MDHLVLEVDELVGVAADISVQGGLACEAGFFDDCWLKGAELIFHVPNALVSNSKWPL
jgi:hypothetical protein